jgi:hypothetical protein
VAVTPKKAPKVPRRGSARSVLPSAPEVKVTYASAGRETLQAIETELTSGLSVGDAPIIEISEAPAGRETLAAIAEELAENMRPRQNTLRYADRIPNAPGAKAPRKKSDRPRAQATAAAPAVAAPAVPPGPAEAAPAADSAPATPALQAEPQAEVLEIFELLTFIVRGNKVGDLSTEGVRRRFVEQHLLHRLPGQRLEAVERIEVTPWTAKGTMVVRIWCRA